MATPYVIDIPTVAGNVQQTLANLMAMRNDILANPRPQYNLHGEAYDWPKMYDFISREIDNCMRQASQLAPFEFVSVAR